MQQELDSQLFDHFSSTHYDATPYSDLSEFDNCFEEASVRPLSGNSEDREKPDTDSLEDASQADSLAEGSPVPDIGGQPPRLNSPPQPLNHHIFSDSESPGIMSPLRPERHQEDCLPDRTTGSPARNARPSKPSLAIRLKTFLIDLFLLCKYERDHLDSLLSECKGVEDVLVHSDLNNLVGPTPLTCSRSKQRSLPKKQISRLKELKLLTAVGAAKEQLFVPQTELGSESKLSLRSDELWKSAASRLREVIRNK